MIIVGIRNDIDVSYDFPVPLLREDEWVPISAVVKELAIPESKYYFSQRAVERKKQYEARALAGFERPLSYSHVTSGKSQPQLARSGPAR